MALLKSKPAPGVVSLPGPQRVALMHAIKAHTTATEGLARVEQAGQQASEKVWARTDAVTAATKAVADAGADLGAYVFAGPESGPPPTSKRAARTALAEAEAELQDARDAREALRATLDVAKHEVEAAALAVRRAAEAVIAAEGAEVVSALAAETTKLSREVLTKGAALAWLFRAGAAPNAYDNGGGGRADLPRDPAVREALGQFGSLYQPANLGAWSREAVAAGAAPWDAALHALTRDASAPLPL